MVQGGLNNQKTVIMVRDSLRDQMAFITGAHSGSGSHNEYGYNNSKYDNPIRDVNYYIRIEKQDVFSAFNILIGIVGMLGNGMVIWLLGFRVKKNPFTTYVLNLAIADFGVLTTAIVTEIITIRAERQATLTLVLLMIYFFMGSTSQYLLTVISMNRCIAVFFPIWYRCHRPIYLSTIVCILIWLIPIFVIVITFIILLADGKTELVFSLFIVHVCLPLPLMIISSLMLFFKLCCKPKQQRKKKLLITIMITVFFFLFVASPLTAMFMHFYIMRIQFYFPSSVLLFGILNSSINPFIYYLVGRPRKGRSNKSMKVALQKLFKEEEMEAQGVHRTEGLASNQQPRNNSSADAAP